MKARILTALVGVPLVLTAVACTNPGPLYALVAITCMICAYEAEGIFSRQDRPDPNPYGLFILAAVLVFPALLIYTGERGNLNPTRMPDHRLLLPSAAALFVLGLISAFRAAKDRSGPSMQRGTAALWFSIPLVALVFIHPWDRAGDWALSWRTPLLLVLVPVWAGDIAAMLGGMAFGKHPLAPSISPKKTWEGAVCNFLAASLAGWGIGAWLVYDPLTGLLCGTATGIFGQLGDLFESALKRMADKKDSGSVLPGHGGALDRIDALLWSVIPTWFILSSSGAI